MGKMGLGQFVEFETFTEQFPLSRSPESLVLDITVVGKPLAEDPDTRNFVMVEARQGLQVAAEN